MARRIRFSMYTRFAKRLKHVEELKSRLSVAQKSLDEMAAVLEMTPEMLPIFLRHPRAFFRASNELRRIENRRGLRAPAPERLEELRRLALRHEGRYRRPVTAENIEKERQHAIQSEQKKAAADKARIEQHKRDKAARTELQVETFKKLAAELAAMGLPIEGLGPPPEQG